MPNYSFLTGLRVTSDWSTHRARGSLGGLDLACPVGTNILAPGDGVVDYRTAGTGGWTVRIKYDNGYQHEFMHCSVEQFLPDGTRVREGDQIGESGGVKGSPGSGSSTGPHIHVHAVRPDGVRVPYDQAVVPGTGLLPATVRTDPIFDWVEPTSIQIRKIIQDGLKERGRYAGPVDGVWGTKTIIGIQKTIAGAGFYPGRIDGDPEGPLTCWGVQAYAQKWGGYDGPLDKKLGPNSWLGFARGLNPDLK